MVRSVVAVAICLLVVFGAAPSRVLSGVPPTLPVTFYGSVTIDASPAADGTLIEAHINGVLVGSTQAMTAQGQPGLYVIDIPGEPGQIVSFSAGAVLLSPTGNWVSSAPIRLDLSGTTPTATPTSTSTSTPTPTDTPTNTSTTTSTSTPTGTTTNTPTQTPTGSPSLTATATRSTTPTSTTTATASPTPTGGRATSTPTQTAQPGTNRKLYLPLIARPLAAGQQ